MASALFLAIRNSFPSESKVVITIRRESGFDIVRFCSLYLSYKEASLHTNKTAYCFDLQQYGNTIEIARGIRKMLVSGQVTRYMVEGIDLYNRPAPSPIEEVSSLLETPQILVIYNVRLDPIDVLTDNINKITDKVATYHLAINL